MYCAQKPRLALKHKIWEIERPFAKLGTSRQVCHLKEAMLKAWWLSILDARPCEASNTLCHSIVFSYTGRRIPSSCDLYTHLNCHTLSIPSSTTTSASMIRSKCVPQHDFIEFYQLKYLQRVNVASRFINPSRHPVLALHTRYARSSNRRPNHRQKYSLLLSASQFVQ